jgi:short-subunit dehydrogenase
MHEVDRQRCTVIFQLLARGRASPEKGGASPEWGRVPPCWDGITPYSYGAHTYSYGALPYWDGVPPYWDGAPPYWDGAPPYSYGALPYWDGVPPYWDGVPPYSYGARTCSPKACPHWGARLGCPINFLLSGQVGHCTMRSREDTGMSFSKVIVITGASSGIGAELARQLAVQGHHLVLAARRREELEAVAGQCGPETLAVVTDVRRRGDVEHLLERTLDKRGQVDVWVNNAGRGINRRVMELTDDDVDEMIAVNLKSALYGMQAIIPHFMESGEGHLINVSSFLSRVPLATIRSVYSASKAALNALTANLRMDLRQEFPNIHVSLVMPGLVATAFASNALGEAPAVPPLPGALKAQSVEDVATAIANLIENPVPEIYTNPAQANIVRRYYDDVGAFEAGFGQAPPKA